jgi:hypothetical protein
MMSPAQIIGFINADQRLIQKMRRTAIQYEIWDLRDCLMTGLLRIGP